VSSLQTHSAPSLDSVAIIFNPIAGKGKSFQIAKRVAKQLEHLGVRTGIHECAPLFERDDMLEFLQPFKAVVIAGGDGTLLKMLPLLLAANKPVYMLPTGNESLFARHFAMDESAETLAKRLTEARTTSCFIPVVNQVPFFTMVSVGFDSRVVYRVCNERSGPVGDLGYVLPTLKELFVHRAPELSLRVDGRQVLEKRRGFLIIGNTSEYALGTRFVPEASAQVCALHARFIPYSSSLGFIATALKALLGDIRLQGTTALYSGSQFEVTLTDSQYPIQADGEFIGDGSFVVESTDSSLFVLGLASTK